MRKLLLLATTALALGLSTAWGQTIDYFDDPSTLHLGPGAGKACARGGETPGRRSHEWGLVPALAPSESGPQHAGGGRREGERARPRLPLGQPRRERPTVDSPSSGTRRQSSRRCFIAIFSSVSDYYLEFKSQSENP